MFDNLRPFFGKRGRGYARAGLAFIFLLSGFGMASAFHWAGASETQSALVGPTSIALSPSVPGSFADLAKHLWTESWVNRR